MTMAEPMPEQPVQIVGHTIGLCRLSPAARRTTYNDGLSHRIW
jgi:hypothetical protein